MLSPAALTGNLEEPFTSFPPCAAIGAIAEFARDTITRQIVCQ